MLVVTVALTTSLREDRAFMLDVSIPAILASISACSSSNLVLLAVMDALITIVSAASTVCRTGLVTACLHFVSVKLFLDPNSLNYWLLS